MSVEHRIPAAVQPGVRFPNKITGTALAERTGYDSSADDATVADEQASDDRGGAAQNDNPARGEPEEQPAGNGPEQATPSALRVASSEASGAGSEQGPTPPEAAETGVQNDSPAAPEQPDMPRKAPTNGSAGLVPPVTPGKPLAEVPPVVYSAPPALDSPIAALAMAASNATAALASTATAPATAPVAANVQGALPGSTAQNASAQNSSAQNTSAQNTSTPNTSAPNTSAQNTGTPNTSAPNMGTPSTGAPNLSTPQGATLPVSIPGHTPQGVPGLSAEQMQFVAMNAMSAGAFPPQYGAPWFAPGMPLNMFALNSASSDKPAPGAHAGTPGTPGMPGTPQSVPGGIPGLPNGIPGFGAYPGGAYAFNSPFTPGLPPSAGFTPGSAPTPGSTIAPVGSLDLSQLAPSNPMLAMSMGMQMGMPMGYPGMMMYPPMLPNQFPPGMAVPPGFVPPMGYGAFGNLAIAQAAQARAAQAAQAQAAPSPSVSTHQPTGAQPVRPSAGSPQHRAETVKPEALAPTAASRAPNVPSSASPRTPGTPMNAARQETAQRSVSSPNAPPQPSTGASTQASTQTSTRASTEASTQASTRASTQPHTQPNTQPNTQTSTQHKPSSKTSQSNAPASVRGASSPQADAQRFSARKTMFRISSTPKEPSASSTENPFMRQTPVGTLWPPGMMPPPNVAPSGDMPPPPPALTNPTRIDSSLYEDRERERHDYEALRRRRDSYLAGVATKPPKLPRSKRYWLDQQAELVSNLERRGFVAIYRETPEYSRFFCSLCNKDFETKLLCIRHAVEHLNFKPFRCTDCDMEFTRCDTLQRHLKGRCLGPESQLYQPVLPKRETAAAKDDAGAPPAVVPRESDDEAVELVRVNTRRRNRVDKTRFADDDVVRPPAALWHAPEGFTWKKSAEPPAEPPAKRVKQESPPPPVRKGPAPVVMPAARRG